MCAAHSECQSDPPIGAEYLVNSWLQQANHWVPWFDVERLLQDYSRRALKRAHAPLFCFVFTEKKVPVTSKAPYIQDKT